MQVPGERRFGCGEVTVNASDGARMNIDPDKVDEAVLALLALGLHQGSRAWNGFDWDAMRRLHAKGYISGPVGKAKSVEFTEAGLRESPRLLQARFRR